MWYRSCWCWRYLSHSSMRLKICSVVLHPALKLACSSAKMVSACSLSLFSKIFSMTFLGWYIRLIVREFWHWCGLPFLGRVMTSNCVHSVGHSPVCQILLADWISSAGILFIPADFLSFSDSTVVSMSSWRIGWSSVFMAGGMLLRNTGSGRKSLSSTLSSTLPCCSSSVGPLLYLGTALQFWSLSPSYFSWLCPVLLCQFCFFLLL